MQETVVTVRKNKSREEGQRKIDIPDNLLFKIKPVRQAKEVVIGQFLIFGHRLKINT